MHDVYNKLARVQGSSENTGCAHADRNRLAFLDHSVQDLLPTERRYPIQSGERVILDLTTIGSYRYTNLTRFFRLFQIGEDISSYYGSD